MVHSTGEVGEGEGRDSSSAVTRKSSKQKMNQKQIQPTYHTCSRIATPDKIVGGEASHQFPLPRPCWDAHQIIL